MMSQVFFLLFAIFVGLGQEMDTVIESEDDGSASTLAAQGDKAMAAFSFVLFVAYAGVGISMIVAREHFKQSVTRRGGRAMVTHAPPRDCSND